jgi:hypothetical protein
MLGYYENFPLTIHWAVTFFSLLSRRKMQKRIAQVFQELNLSTFSFEEVGSPTVPNSILIFEFGIAEDAGFSYLNEEENRKLQNALDTEPMKVMDWFCAIRYYKNVKGKKMPLKFDYYLLRMGFAEKDAVEVSVFHEKGPRYLAPEDVIDFIQRKINQSSKRKTLIRAGHN